MSETRETTFDERMKWGVCPVCAAKHGEYCDSNVGFQMGRRADGSPMQTGQGIHLARLQAAPKLVRLVPVG